MSTQNPKNPLVTGIGMAKGIFDRHFGKYLDGNDENGRANKKKPSIVVAKTDFLPECPEDCARIFVLIRQHGYPHNKSYVVSFTSKKDSLDAFDTCIEYPVIVNRQYKLSLYCLDLAANGPKSLAYLLMDIINTGLVPYTLIHGRLLASAQAIPSGTEVINE